MSSANVEIVQALYLDPRPLNNNPLVASDAEFDFTELYPDRPVLRGSSEMQRFRDSGPWGRSIHFEPERYFDVDDDRVLALVRISSTGQESGVPVSGRIAQEFTLRNGQVARVKTYREPEDALTVLGLKD